MARPRTVGKKIDFKNWATIPSLAAGVSTNGTTQGGALNFLGPATILRCRGYVSAAFDQSVQLGDKFKLTFGLGIVSTNAFNAGAASMPQPDVDPEYPWLWWHSMNLEAFLAAGHGAWGYAQ